MEEHSIKVQGVGTGALAGVGLTGEVNIGYRRFHVCVQPLDSLPETKKSPGDCRPAHRQPVPTLTREMKEQGLLELN